MSKWRQSVRWEHKCSMVIFLQEGDTVIHRLSAFPSRPLRNKKYAGKTATVILAEKQGVISIEPSDIVYTAVFGADGALSSIPEAEKGTNLTIIIHAGEQKEKLTNKKQDG